ncbi:translation elongation factor EF-G [Clostridium beijerinckii]|nr:translation elongation factor EF-G [Clostridium beijerinckii]
MKLKIGKKMIMEAVAETDEVLLDKYFSEGELSDEEIYKGLISGCASGDIAPVCVEVLQKLLEWIL